MDFGILFENTPGTNKTIMMFGLQMFNEMENLQREIDQMFRGIGLSPALEPHGLSPRFKLSDDGEAFTVAATLPGIDVDKLDISVIGRRLTISGEAAARETPEEVVWHRRERTVGGFRQSLNLPERVDVEKVAAE